MKQNIIHRVKQLEQGSADGFLIERVRQTLDLIKKAAVGEAGTVDPETGIVTLKLPLSKS